jgi:hypothetical protein
MVTILLLPAIRWIRTLLTQYHHVELIKAHGQFINWGISLIGSQRCDTGDHDRSPRPILVVYQKGSGDYHVTQSFIWNELKDCNEMVARTLAVENDRVEFVVEIKTIHVENPNTLAMNRYDSQVFHNIIKSS